MHCAIFRRKEKNKEDITSVIEDCTEKDEKGFDKYRETINEYKEGKFLLPLDARNIPELEAELQKLVTHNGQFQAYILLFAGIAGYGTPNAQKVIDFYIDKM